jgi:hypothetical protein
VAGVLLHPACLVARISGVRVPHNVKGAAVSRQPLLLPSCWAALDTRASLRLGPLLPSHPLLHCNHLNLLTTLHRLHTWGQRQLPLDYQLVTLRQSSAHWMSQSETMAPLVVAHHCFPDLVAIVVEGP